MRIRIAGAICAVGFALVGLTACSKSVDADSLAGSVKEALQPKYQVELEQVQCKGSLKAEKGQTQVCVLESGDQWQLVNVTASDSDGKFEAEAVPGVVPKPDWAK